MRLQRSRVASYTAGALLALVLKPLGCLDISWRSLVVLYAASLVSVGLSSAVLRTGRAVVTAASALSWLPVAFDMLFISFCVYLSGGIHSPWYI
ncbi:MAG TPA: hypothetical protein VIA18_30235, partial [Polyangia bacterium]|nr:hypothetical protein [Polyangia bacterium]